MALYILVALFVVGSAGRLILFNSRSVWKMHRKFVLLVWLVDALCFIAILFVPVSALSVLFGLSLIYAFINYKRIRLSRLPDLHLKSLAKHTAIRLSILQGGLIFTLILLSILSIDVSAEHLIIFGAFASAVSSFIIALATISNIWGSKPKKIENLSDDELPTVTVAIAARNETPMLTECLESVLSSDYPKLEIIVLDDDSQDTTAEIIKSFAHDGVRFVRSEYPHGSWMAKNRAYESLLRHSSGDYIFFMGVDVQIYPESIRRLTEQIVGRNLYMITVVPKRIKSGLVASFIQPIRYWWELALPKLYIGRPPALSTSWIVHRNSLESIGGFTSYKRSIIPEEHLAKHFSSFEKYAFVRSNSELSITTQKNFLSQWDTQVRTRYPHAHRRPEIAFLQSIALLALCVSPFVGVGLDVIFGILSGYVSLLVWLSAGLLVCSHVIISAITNPISALLAPVNFPVAILLDVIALHVSMVRYEFYRVIWKGRDITPKKLKIISKLPDMDPATN